MYTITKKSKTDGNDFCYIWQWTKMPIFLQKDAYTTKKNTIYFVIVNGI
jgi:hypothetical protein